MHLHAPFRGALGSATLFTLIDKIGVAAITLAMRAPHPPHHMLGNSTMLSSESPGVADPGTHRFLPAGAFPALEPESPFWLCIGIGRVRRLPADGQDDVPFLHLPLTNVSTAGSERASEPTFLLDHSPSSEAQGTGVKVTRDPWAGHTFVLRGEFVEEPGTEKAGPDGGGGPAGRGNLRGGSPSVEGP